MQHFFYVAAVRRKIIFFTEEVPRHALNTFVIFVCERNKGIRIAMAPARLGGEETRLVQSIAQRYYFGSSFSG